jgi:serine/threonine protein kinase
VGPDDFDYAEVLGAGSFGRVHKVSLKYTGEPLAMKVLERSKIEGHPADLMKYFRAERNVMSSIRHPFIVPVSYAFQTPNQFVLVMKYCAGGSLQALIRRLGRLPLELCRLYAAEVLLALVHLHEKKVLYRDLKPDNVVLDEERHAMLTDFGLSKQCKEDAHATSFCGSPCFLAPEVLNRNGHDHTVDIYGLGVLVFNMLVGRTPFYNVDAKKTIENIRSGELALPGNLDTDAAWFIRDTMRVDPAERLGANNTADVQEHAFLQCIDFDAVLKKEIPVPQIPEEPEVSTKRSGPKLKSSNSKRREIFGRGICCARVFNCFDRRPVANWSFTDGEAATEALDVKKALSRANSSATALPIGESWWSRSMRSDAVAPKSFSEAKSARSEGFGLSRSYSRSYDSKHIDCDSLRGEL